MNEIINIKDNWLNEVEFIVTEHSFMKIDDNTYSKETIGYTGGQTIIVNGQRMEQPGQQIKITQSIKLNGDGCISNMDDSCRRDFTQIIFSIGSGEHEDTYEECIYWDDANRVKQIIDQIFKL